MNSLLASMLSAFSYIDVIAGDNAQDMKDLYHDKVYNESQDDSVLFWGQGHFNSDYLSRMEVMKSYHKDNSFSAYILADHNNKQLHVVFRGTQEILDYVEDAAMALNLMRSQEDHIPEVLSDLKEIMEDLAFQDYINGSRFKWADQINVTGHSLGGYLARVFSEKASQEGVMTENITFNAPIPLLEEQGTHQDLMLYSEPWRWDFTSGLVHNGMTEHSVITNNVGIVSNAEGHGIVSIVNALNSGIGSVMNASQYANYIVDRMVDGTIMGSAYGSAVSMLERISDNWEDRSPNIMSLIMNDGTLRANSYKVSLDGNYAYDGFREEFTQVPTWDGSIDTVVDAGTLNDVAFLGLGNVTFLGGEGVDLVSYKLINNGIILNGAAVEIIGIQGPDLLGEIEQFEGSQGDDKIQSSMVNLIRGLEGDDTIIGSSANETIQGGAGDDYIEAGGGNDHINTATSFEMKPGDLGHIDAGNDYVDAGAGDDHVTADAGTDILMGGTGRDTLSYQNATESVIWDQNSYGDGFGFTDAVSGFETVSGSKFNDHFEFMPYDGITMAYGGEGNDVLIGSRAQERLYGGNGSDILEGREGSDALYGGSGDDFFVFKEDSARSSDIIDDFEGAGMKGGDMICVPAGYNFMFREETNGNTTFMMDIDQDGKYSYLDINVRIKDGNVLASAYTVDDILFI